MASRPAIRGNRRAFYTNPVTSETKIFQRGQAPRRGEAVPAGPAEGTRREPPYSIGFWTSGCWTARGVPFCVR